jgi:hypothetical protein
MGFHFVDTTTQRKKGRVRFLLLAENRSVALRLTFRRGLAPGNRLDDTGAPSPSETRQRHRKLRNYCFSVHVSLPRRVDTRPTLATWVIFMTSRRLRWPDARTRRAT